jgi:hypothetical protein
MGGMKIACSIFVGKSGRRMIFARSECRWEHDIKFVNWLANVAGHSHPSGLEIWHILLTAIGLTPGGSSAVHIYTQTVHRTTQ